MVKKPKLLKVGVLMGGPSHEHEISLLTAQNVIANLDSNKYQSIAIKISQKGQWFLNNKLSSQNDALKSCDLIFNALHGTFGEDGKIQSILEYKNIKYTGSRVAASALAMDKYHSREIFKLAGFNVPRTMKIKEGENYSARLNFFVNKIIKLPVVIKPGSNGSSVGVQIVNDPRRIKKALADTFKLDNEILVEEFIKGREVTCGVLEDAGQVTALPVTEIVPLKNNKFFNYNAKYKSGHSNEMTPAPIDGNVYQKVQDLAVRAHQILGCRAYSRTDMIFKSNGTIYVLETNTLPGLTKTSLLPQAAEYAGITFNKLINTIIESSLV